MYLILLAILVKCMLIQLYYSTDFDVHRNWMRLTTEQPISQWYYDDQSIWTLDYPPLFAYLEFIFGKIALFLNIDLYNISDALVYFQRISVIITELLYFYAVRKQEKTFTKQLIDLIPFGCLLIDNIHFQYNGFLYGLLLLVCYKLKRQEYTQASLLYVVLLSFKHIYIYVLPAFGVVLLKNCKIKQIIIMGVQCVGLGLVIFAPFYSDILQLIKRMFPLQRGLVHAYWAQNFWSIYCAIDKTLGIIFKINRASTATGVVQETVFNVMPQIGSLATLLIIGSLCLLLLRKKYRNIYEIFTISSLIFFNFGYHVHEKAIMIPLILQLVEMKNVNLTFLASFVNGVSLLPLIPTAFELPILILLLLIYHIVFYVEYQIKLKSLETIYIILGAFLIIYNNCIHYLIFGSRLEFVPLILYSLYGSFFNQYWLYVKLSYEEYEKLC